MTAAQLDDAGLDLGRHLMRTAIGLGALVGECSQALRGVAHQPAMKGPSIDPVADRGVLDGGPVEHLSHRVIALLNHRRIH
jgi:hypothetical protein